MDFLHQTWKKLAANYCSDEKLITEFWSEIERQYSSPNRYYHNLQHIGFMLRMAEDFKHKIHDFDTLLFSVFYHDIIYNFSRSDNEEQSAAVAKKRLATLQVPADKTDKCVQQILATKIHNSCNDPDTNFLVDFDLLILGQSWETYQEYARSIRKEYSDYPQFLYNKGRRKVLQSFLEKERIYNSKEIFTLCEEKARENLKRELETL